MQLLTRYEASEIDSKTAYTGVSLLWDVCSGLVEQELLRDLEQAERELRIDMNTKGTT